MEIRILDRIDKNPHGQKITHFNKFKVSLKYDTVASPFYFEWLFDPDDENAINLAHVSHFHIVEVHHNGEQLLKGYILSESFTDKSVATTNALAGYSLPGVIEDCQIPPDISMQFDNMTFREIVKKILAPFAFSFTVDSSVSALMDTVFPVTQVSDGDTIKKFLTDLASQKDINITHDRYGNLLFTKVKANLKPIAYFKRGLPGVEMSLVFNGQPLHSHITVRKQASIDGGNAGESTVRNPYVPYVYRPKVIKQDSGDDIATDQAARNALAEELKNIKLIIKISRWDNFATNKIFRPNNVISVLNREIFIYEKTDFFIEAVDLEGDEKEMTATLTCVLVEVYNGKTPQNIFTKWEQ